MSDRLFDNVPDIPGRFTAVAYSLRELADKLEKFDLPPNTAHLLNVSSELKQIGWNTLFVGSAVDALLMSSFGRSNLDRQNSSEQLRQVDALHVAVSYLSRSVRFLTRNAAGQAILPTEVQEAFQRLGEKLQEVACECQRA